LTLDEKIVHALYETLDHQRPSDRRYRAVDYTVAARRARRKGDLAAVAFNYDKAAKELRSSSNDKAHRAIRMIEEEVIRLRYSGYA